MSKVEDGSKSQTKKLVASNKKAFFSYHIEKKMEAGIELLGSEVKACREAKAQMADAYASIERGQLYLYKMYIGEYKQSGPYMQHEPTRKRRLLMHKREIRNLLASLEQKGYTLLPLELYLKNGRLKVELGLGRGKNKADKRQSSKNRDAKREISGALKRQSQKR